VAVHLFRIDNVAPNPKTSRSLIIKDGRTSRGSTWFPGLVGVEISSDVRNDSRDLQWEVLFITWSRITLLLALLLQVQPPVDRHIIKDGSITVVDWRKMGVHHWIRARNSCPCPSLILPVQSASLLVSRAFRHEHFVPDGVGGWIVKIQVILWLVCADAAFSCC
jgi:hypothetical protein